MVGARLSRKGILLSLFSVILATRDRPKLFKSALDSVLTQSYRDVEIIVVNDGSDPANQAQYDAILSNVPSGRVAHSLILERRQKGHGQSFAINTGAEKATGQYLCFLDDDDYWTDPGHLERAQGVIASAEGLVELYMAEQTAFVGDQRRAGPIWIEDLSGILRGKGKRPDSQGAYSVTVDDLLLSHGFCHLNTLVVRRGLFEEIGGMEESIRWECDHDLYLRLIDRANLIKYAPVVVSRHNIPDPAIRASMTTSLSESERRLFQLAVFESARRLSHHKAIRDYADIQRVYTLKRIAVALAGARRYADAAHYAREALRIRITTKWAVYTGWLTLLCLGRTPR